MPAHVSRQRRWRVAALVVLVVAGVGIAVGVRGRRRPSRPRRRSARWSARRTRSRPPGTARASPRRGAPSPGFLVLTNTTARTVTADITATSDSGATADTTAAVPAHGVVTRPSRARIGLLGVRDRHHVGRGCGGHPDGERLFGLVTGSVPDHDLGPVVFRRWLDRGGQHALHIAAESHLDAGRGGSQLRDAGWHGPSDQLSGDRAPAGSGGGGERGVGGAADQHRQHHRQRADRPGRRVEVQGMVGAGATSGGLAWCLGSPPRRPMGLPQAQEVAGGNAKSMSSTPGHHGGGHGAVPVAVRAVGPAHGQGRSGNDVGDLPRARTRSPPVRRM